MPSLEELAHELEMLADDVYTLTAPGTAARWLERAVCFQAHQARSGDDARE